MHSFNEVWFRCKTERLTSEGRPQSGVTGTGRGFTTTEKAG